MIYGLVAELVPVVAWSKRSADVGIIIQNRTACQVCLYFSFYCDTLLFMAQKKDIVAKAYAERDREIVRLHKAKWSLREIGHMFELSYERVRQILQDQKIKGAK